MTRSIQQAATVLAQSSHCVALTGAGISVESGIPPFRGKGGLWEKFDPMEYAHVDAFKRDPEKVWKVLFLGLQEVLQKASPNGGHLGLFDLEQMGRLQTIVTQNIDGLHQQAGSRDVIEFHGTFSKIRCTQCNARLNADQVNLKRLPPQCDCGGILRPDVVMFGEIIPVGHLQRAQQLASACDTMLVVGTSATVEPAAYLPLIAKRAGAAIIEINPETTSLTHQVSDITVLGQAGTVMTELVDAVKQML